MRGRLGRSMLLIAAAALCAPLDEERLARAKPKPEPDPKPEPPPDATRGDDE